MSLALCRGLGKVLLGTLGLAAWTTLAVPSALSAGPAGETGEIEVGELVPGLEVEEIVDGPEPAALGETLGSEAVVLEMWATWCGPCVGAIGEWNEMVEEMAGEPVRFVSVTDERAEPVRRFLGRKPISGWVALDRDRSIFDTFGIEGIPRTIFIDAEGRLRGMSHPNHVTADTVRTLLAGEPLGLPKDPSGGDEVAVDPEGRPRPLYEVSLRPTTLEGTRIRSGGPFFEAQGALPEMLVTYAWDVPRTRLTIEADLPDERYDFAVLTGGKSPEQARAAARLALETVFGLESEAETREREVWLLTRLPNAESKLHPAVVESGFSYGHGRMTAMSITVEDLAAALENLLAKPVLDETGLEGEWEVELEWDQGEGKETSLLEAVRETLGLELKPAEREIEVTVVRRRNETPTTGDAAGAGGSG